MLFFFLTFLTLNTNKSKVQSAQPLSNLQQELLKLYSSNIEDADLENVRAVPGQIFCR
jgi:hypothetical protein